MRSRMLTGGGLLLAGVALFAASSAFSGGDDTDLKAEYQKVKDVVAYDTYTKMRPIHRSMLSHIVETNVKAHRPVVAACWDRAGAPTEQDVIDAFNAAITGGGAGEFQQTSRWTSTALSGGGLGQGDPTTLTYGFPPDGTNIPNGIGEGAGPNALFAMMNGIYGNPTVWMQIYADEFARWASVSGLSYVFEPNDDGSSFFGLPGQSGVRADCRLGAKPLDGNSGVLAYNFFPQNGDMVLDSADNFFNTTSNDSRRLRNIIAHEHGHGMGQLHVCPSNGTKLMEPFITTSFLAAQHDDIQNANRHYGDPYEDNDSIFQATDLGLQTGGTVAVNGASTDDNGDSDFYGFQIAGTFDVTVTVTPIGFTYDQGPQTSGCGGGSPYNSLNQHNLGIEVLNSTGQVVASANAQPAGVAETLPNVNISSGQFFIRVFPDNVNTIQLYDMTAQFTPSTPPAFVIDLPNGVPASVTPDVPTPIDVVVTNGTGMPDPSTAVLSASINGGAFSSTALTDLGGGSFQGMIPAAPCFSTIDFFISIEPTTGPPAVTAPPGAPSFNFTTVADNANLTPVFSDNFNTNMGWTVTNGAGLSDGAWERAVPAGGGDRGDPPTDGDGSGFAFVTDNADGNSDVDGGATILTSPSIDLSGQSNARISFLFWYDNDFGGSPNQDIFEMEISSNGSTFVLFENYNANTDTWNPRSLIVGDYVSLTSNVQMRFTASDTGAGSVVEAVLDGFVVEVCTPSSALDGPCADGFVGVLQGLGPHDVLLVNGNEGGSDRIVDGSVGDGFQISMIDPPNMTGSNFLIYGHIGIPDAGNEFLVSPLIGTFCFTPCIVQPGNTNLFNLTNNFGADSCPQAVVSTPTPYTLNVPAGLINFPFSMTLQGIILEPLGRLSVTNGIALRHQ